MVLFLALFRPSECLLEVGARSISARSREAVLPGWPRNRDRLVADGGAKCNLLIPESHPAMRRR